MKNVCRKILRWSPAAIFISVLLLFYSIFLFGVLFSRAYEIHFDVSPLAKEEIQNLLTDFYSFISEDDINKTQNLFLPISYRLSYTFRGDDEFLSMLPFDRPPSNDFFDDYSIFKDRYGILSGFSITNFEYHDVIDMILASAYIVDVITEYQNIKTHDSFWIKKTMDGLKIFYCEINIQDQI